MACSKEEIERKRLAALERIQLNKQTPQPGRFLSFSPSALVNIENQPRRPYSTSSNQKSYTTKCSNNVVSRNFIASTKKSCHPYNRPSPKTEAGSSNILTRKVTSGSVYMISEGRFEVNPSEYCQILFDVFKTIKSRNYDAKTKLWNFSLCDYDELQSKVSCLKPDIVLGKIPQFVLNVLKQPVANPESVDLSPIESKLLNKLMPFQREGVSFGILKNGRCMIADDMGLGKTYQALAIASYYRQNWPLLIVTTSSMRETWQSKIHELLPSVPMMNTISVGCNKESALIGEAQTEVAIVSYKMATVTTQMLKEKRFGVVILDESHYMKSHKAQCTVSLTSVCRRAARVLLLSGTPALSRPVELYCQLDILHPYFFNGYAEYGIRYCNGKMTNFGWDMSGQSHLAELQLVLQRKFLIRRTKEQVLTNLTERLRETVLLDPTLLDFSSETVNGLNAMAQQYQQTMSAEKHCALITYFSESSSFKIPAICKYIGQLLKDENTEKFLVFAHHKNVIEAICDKLNEQRVNYICIVGSTRSDSRAGLVEHFQNSVSCRCAVLSITAANAGITLTAAQLVLFAELHWNPGILTQAESRAHRIGQLGNVRVRYLLARGTSDDYMWPMLQKKLNVLNNVGLSKDTFEENTLTMQESKNTILNYVTSPKDKNDYIPGTNIRKDKLNHSDVLSAKNNIALEHKPAYNIAHQPDYSRYTKSGHESGQTDDCNQLIAADLQHEYKTSFMENSALKKFQEDMEKSFLEDSEGDEILASVNF